MYVSVIYRFDLSPWLMISQGSEFELLCYVGCPRTPSPFSGFLYLLYFNEAEVACHLPRSNERLHVPTSDSGSRTIPFTKSRARPRAAWVQPTSWPMQAGGIFVNYGNPESISITKWPKTCPCPCTHSRSITLNRTLPISLPSSHEAASARPRPSCPGRPTSPCFHPYGRTPAGRHHRPARRRTHARASQ